MGVQSAAIGAGMVFVNAAGGVLGKFGFPRTMLEVADKVDNVSTTMAVACLNFAMNLGLLISPLLMNFFTKVVYSEVTTVNVYKIAAIGMVLIAGIVMIAKRKEK